MNDWRKLKPKFINHYDNKCSTMHFNTVNIFQKLITIVQINLPSNYIVIIVNYFLINYCTLWINYPTLVEKKAFIAFVTNHDSVISSLSLILLSRKCMYIILVNTLPSHTNADSYYNIHILALQQQQHSIYEYIQSFSFCNNTICP